MRLLRLPSATQCKVRYENETAGHVDRQSYRHMRIWIDSGGLHAAVPDVAEEVVRTRRSGQETTAHGNADEKNGRERSSARRAVRPSPDHEPCGDGIRHALEQENDADVRVVEVRNPDCTDGRKRQQEPASANSGQSSPVIHLTPQPSGM